MRELVRVEDFFVMSTPDKPIKVVLENNSYIRDDGTFLEHYSNWGYNELCDILGYGEDMDIKRKIKKVIFNDPATVVYWADGSKTVVKTMPGDEFCPEYGLSMAICKKYFGSNSAYKRYVREWIKE